MRTFATIKIFQRHVFMMGGSCEDLARELLLFRLSRGYAFIFALLLCVEVREAVTFCEEC